MPLSGGAKFRIAVASAVVFFFGNLACFQLGGSCAPCGKHSVKLRYVASFVDVIYIPVVEKQILWSKRCKDESFRGTVKEIIQQVSMSKKWASKPALDENSTPILSTKGKPVLKKSYSVLQDDFFRYMHDAGYDDGERGERGRQLGGTPDRNAVQSAAGVGTVGRTHGAEPSAGTAGGDARQTD